MTYTSTEITGIARQMGLHDLVALLSAGGPVAVEVVAAINEALTPERVSFDDILVDLALTVSNSRVRPTNARMIDRTIEAFRANHATEIPVVVGGYGLDVFLYDGKLVGISPRAKASRGASGAGNRLTAWPLSPNLLSRREKMEIAWKTYIFPDGPDRARSAVKIALEAFERADGKMEDFFQQLGAAGFCAVCGRALSDPLSVSRGIGPECILKLEALQEMERMQERGKE